MTDKYSQLKQTLFGFLSGAINVIIFNPFDRALNIATKNHTTIFISSYWNLNSIYQGVHHGFIQRTISYGLWYPIVNIIDINMHNLNMKNNFVDNKIISSVMASGFIGFITSPISSAKQQYWNSDQKIGILKFSKQMYKIGGHYAFMRGTLVTIKRDMLFGSIFGYLSFSHNKEKKFIFDAMYATIATTLSSPFNYIRVMKYKTECNVKTSSVVIFTDLIKSVKKECNKNILYQIIYTFHNKFNVGWGSIRVGCGMALSRQLFEYFNQFN